MALSLPFPFGATDAAAADAAGAEEKMARKRKIETDSQSARNAWEFDADVKQELAEAAVSATTTATPIGKSPLSRSTSSSYRKIPRTQSREAKQLELDYKHYRSLPTAAITTQYSDRVVLADDILSGRNGISPVEETSIDEKLKTDFKHSSEIAIAVVRWPNADHLLSLRLMEGVVVPDSEYQAVRALSETRAITNVCIVLYILNERRLTRLGYQTLAQFLKLNRDLAPVNRMGSYHDTVSEQQAAPAGETPEQFRNRMKTRFTAAALRTDSDGRLLPLGRVIRIGYIRRDPKL